LKHLEQGLLILSRICRAVNIAIYVLSFFDAEFMPSEGKLGEMLQTVYQIKLNGLEYLFNNKS